MPQELPLFPLSTVLFPGMVLPLHIFEPRYRAMIARCLESDQAFGVVLIKKGREVGETAVPYSIGTAARIAQVERLPEGRMNILSVGKARFRILTLYHRKPYLTGEVEFFQAEDEETETTHTRSRRVKPLLETYIRLLNEAAGVDLGIKEIPDEPTVIAYLAGIAMQISLEDKQTLLSMPSIAKMLGLEIKLLCREEAILRFVARTHDSQEKLMSGPTGYLSVN